MKNYSYIIIDDEHHSRNALSKKLTMIDYNLNELQICTNAAEGIEAIEKYKPDIVFLDIEMPDLTGLEMLHKIPFRNFQLIFTTAYNQYAIDAINLSALSYLLKPIGLEDLKNAVTKAITKIDEHVNQLQINNLVSLLNQNRASQKLVVHILNGIELLSLDKIEYLVADGNYTYIHTMDEKPLLSSKTLKEYEEMLPENLFYRIHNGHIINLNCVKRIIKGDGYQVELLNGVKLDVARRRKDDFWEKINGK